MERGKDLKIERLRIRLQSGQGDAWPDGDAWPEGEARALGREVARLLAERWPAERWPVERNGPLELGALQLRRTAPRDAARGQLAEQIVAAILESLA